MKLDTTIRNLSGGADVQGAVANTDFTSQAIPMTDFSGIVLSFWAESLAVTGTDPHLTVEVSNSIDVDSFEPVAGAIELGLVVALEDFMIEFNYFRFVYVSEGVTAGTIAYELEKI